MKIFDFFLRNVEKGVTFVKENPQIIYTIFLIIVIPLAFLFSGQKFLDAALKNQERLERNRIGLLHDVFVSFAKDKLNDPVFLKARVLDIVNQNKDIEKFKVLKYENGVITIVASINENEVGGEDKDTGNDFLYRSTVLQSGSSLIFEVFDGNIRHWKAVRAISNNIGEPIGFILTDTSMANIDNLAKRNIRESYIFLILIIIGIFYLLVRHTRIVDYTVLYRKLEDVDKMKDDFVSMAAHELRTPLSIIRGYVDILGGAKSLSDSEKQSLFRIDSSAKDLDLLIGDILDVSRLQEGRMSFSMVDADPMPIVSEIVESFQHQAIEKGLKLKLEAEVHDPLRIRIDVARLKQSLINIIGNSIKYTEKGEVLIRSHINQGNFVVRVSDSGIGISAEDQKNLFQKFFRVRSEETKNVRGTGLGLWITNQIIKNMGGTLYVESIKGKGTDFIISFPLIKNG